MYICTMLHKTAGIALKTTNYSESSIVVHIYTEMFGMQSYLVNGAKKPKAKLPANMFQPLHLLDLVVYHKDSVGLQRIKEARLLPPLRAIPFDIIKSSLAIFLNEILYKVLRQQSPDPVLFHFIQQSILWLDESQSNLADFHLVFLVKLSRFLGFLPLHSNEKSRPYFNLMDGVFTPSLPPHSHVLHEPHTSQLRQLMQVSFEESATLKISPDNRKQLLEKLLEFYKLHTENFVSPNSLYILEEIFHR